MNHAELQGAIIEIASLLGWDLKYHTHDSRHSAAGFPDLVLIHMGKRRVVWIEFKVPPDKISPEQTAWHDGLAICDQEVYIVWPEHLEEVKVILTLGHKPNLLERMKFECAVVYNPTIPNNYAHIVEKFKERME